MKDDRKGYFALFSIGEMASIIKANIAVCGRQHYPPDFIACADNFIKMANTYVQPNKAREVWLYQSIEEYLLEHAYLRMPGEPEGINP